MISQAFILNQWLLLYYVLVLTGKAYSDPKKSSKANSLMGSCSRRREDKDPEIPSFYKCVDDSILQKEKLTIPKGFCEHFDGRVPQQYHLQTVAGTWLVCLKKSSEEIFFKKGWKDFVIGNGLKLGEFLVLHYTGNSKFYVEIYGHNYCKRSKARKRDRSLLDDEYDDDAVIVIESDSETSINTVESETQNNELSLAAEIEWRREFSCGKKLSRRGRVGKPATVSLSGNPCFSIKMCQTHVVKGPMLTPRSFMGNMQKPNKVKLQLANMSMAWDVNWIHHDKKSSRFSGGWPRFVKQNKLQEGDVCDFELISNSNYVAVMEVSIRKGSI